MATSSLSAGHFQAQDMLGLDYCLQVYNKMYIKDIIQLKLYPLVNEVFAYKNHPVYKVDILGIIVRVEVRDKCFIYALDDGTGIISCCCWKPNWPKDDVRFDSALPRSLQEKLKELDVDESKLGEGYSHGDLLHVKGKVKIFRNVNDVTAVFHAKVDNPMAEVFRMTELPKLYKACYDRPFVLPLKVQQLIDIEKEENRTGLKSSKRILHELVSCLNDYLKSTSSVGDFMVSQMSRLPQVADILKRQLQTEQQSSVSMVTQALDMLEEQLGVVCKRQEGHGVYENLHHKSALESAILKILVVKTKKTKYSDVGCHEMRILDELHRTVQYSRLHKTALVKTLQKLEGQSDIVSTYHKQYLPCVT